MRSAGMAAPSGPVRSLGRRLNPRRRRPGLRTSWAASVSLPAASITIASPGRCGGALVRETFHPEEAHHTAGSVPPALSSSP